MPNCPKQSLASNLATNSTVFQNKSAIRNRLYSNFTGISECDTRTLRTINELVII